MTIQLPETTQVPPWIDGMKFCHIGATNPQPGDRPLCGAPYVTADGSCGDYEGEAICPTCGNPTCPRCAQLEAFEQELE